MKGFLYSVGVRVEVGLVWAIQKKIRYGEGDLMWAIHLEARIRKLECG
jgi:hypothetical protein